MDASVVESADAMEAHFLRVSIVPPVERVTDCMPTVVLLGNMHRLHHVLVHFVRLEHTKTGRVKVLVKNAQLELEILILHRQQYLHAPTSPPGTSLPKVHLPELRVQPELFADLVVARIVAPLVLLITIRRMKDSLLVLSAVLELIHAALQVKLPLVPANPVLLDNTIHRPVFRVKIVRQVVFVLLKVLALKHFVCLEHFPPLVQRFALLVRLTHSLRRVVLPIFAPNVREER